MSKDDPGRVVSDTGPWISREKIAGGYHFIRRLYDRVIVPPAVLRELAAGAFESEAAYLRHYEIEEQAGREVARLELSLHQVEAEG